MDILGTDGNDTFVQTFANRSTNDTYRGRAGNDTFRLYQGTVYGGAGDDYIERLISPNELWMGIHVAYWDSPGGIVADLEAGYVLDGWGGRDTVRNLKQIAGTWNGDTILGSSVDEEIFTGGGVNIIDGRGGDDLLYLPSFVQGMLVADLTISVSIDGLRAVVTYPGRPEFHTTLTNIERLSVGWPVAVPLSDFIKPEDIAIQGLLAADANRWNAGSALGSAVELSFSFAASAPASGPGSLGFQAFSPAQRDAVRAILAETASVTGLSFREVASGGQLSFGASAQSDSKGLSYLPGTSGAGQVWMDVDTLLSLTPGSESYGALLHEIGHALGLRHPRNVDPGDQYASQMRAADDITAQTVMSQTVSGDGLFRASWGNLDVIALRHLYGTRQVNGGDSTYVLDSKRFLNQSTITDDGGTDSIDASQAPTGVTLNLAPGALSSVGNAASGRGAIDNLALTPGSWIENATGSRFDDIIKGNQLDNVLTGGLGNDRLEGGAGNDTAVFAGRRSDYLISTAFDKVYLAARDGVSGFDTLASIEMLRFADGTLALARAALGADTELVVEQNLSVKGSLPAPSDSVSTGISYATARAPEHGSVVIGADGAYTYTPAAGYFGSDVFSFRLAGPDGAVNTYNAYVTVVGTVATRSGSAGADVLAGSAGNDVLDAGAGNDRISGSAGSDGILGGAGLDWLVYQQARAKFTFASAGNGITTVAKEGGSDTLAGVERIAFSDGTAVALDIDGAAGKTYRVYQAAFDRKPDAAGLGYWLFNMDRGTSIDEVAAAFMQSSEFIGLYGAAPTAAQFVSRLYQNVLHRAPEQGGYDFWVGVVASGYSRAAVLAAFAESAENQAQVIGVIQTGMDYLPFG